MFDGGDKLGKVEGLIREIRWMAYYLFSCLAKKEKERSLNLSLDPPRLSYQMKDTPTLHSQSLAISRV
jgi:hypothetical protein